MASLRTILACTVPVVTALFGIFWLFNKKKSPTPKRLTEPPDKENLLRGKTEVSRENEQSEADKIAEKEEKVNEVKVGDACIADTMCYGDTITNISQKQNESGVTSSLLGNASGDNLKHSEQKETKESNKSEQLASTDSLSMVGVECEDKVNKDSEVNKVSDFRNIIEEQVTSHIVDDVHTAVEDNKTSSDSKIADQIRQDENCCQEEVLVATSANSVNLESVSSSLSHEDVTVKSNEPIALEDLVIPSDRQPLNSSSTEVLDWSKKLEDSLVSEQTELNLDSQIISKQVSESEATCSAVNSVSTSNLSQVPNSLQETNSDVLQNDNSNAIENHDCISAIDEKVIDKTAEKVKLLESSEHEETSKSDSPWVPDQIVTETWSEDNTSRHKTTVSDEAELNSWVVNGEHLETDSVQQNIVENVISNTSANTISPSHRETSHKKVSLEQRPRRGGSVNSSESSSNCDSSSVTSSGSSRGGSTPETVNHHLDDQDHVFEFNMPSDLCGLFIGTRGKTVKAIRDQSGARIRLRNNPYTPDFQICVIEGSQSAIDRACNIIKRKFPAVKYPGIDMTPINNSPVLMPEIMQLSLPEGVSVDIVVSSIVDAGRIFVQQPTHPSFPSLERLNSYMLSCYIQEGAVPDIPRPIENGVICAAPMLNGWYRAQIMAVFDATDECDIKYVDYGGYSRISSQCLKQIRSDFMTLPFEAVECYMANITPLQGENYFSPEAAAVLEELTQGKLLQAQVVGRAEDGIPYVHIYQISGNTSALMVNREMVNRGVARWIEILS